MRNPKSKSVFATFLMIVVGYLATVGSAYASVLSWSAMLDQVQEVPVPAPVPGALGEAFGEIDTVSGALSWNVSFAGLSGPALGMHFHGAAAPGGTAGVVVNIGNISGLLSPSIGMTTITAAQVADFTAGLWYINVHTALNGPGEIRGQVGNFAAVVPVPATALLLAIGLLAMSVRRNGLMPFSA